VIVRGTLGRADVCKHCVGVRCYSFVFCLARDNLCGLWEDFTPLQTMATLQNVPHSKIQQCKANMAVSKECVPKKMQFAEQGNATHQEHQRQSWQESCGNQDLDIIHKKAAVHRCCSTSPVCAFKNARLIFTFATASQWSRNTLQFEAGTSGYILIWFHVRLLATCLTTHLELIWRQPDNQWLVCPRTSRLDGGMNQASVHVFCVKSGDAHAGCNCCRQSLTLFKEHSRIWYFNMVQKMQAENEPNSCAVFQQCWTIKEAKKLLAYWVLVSIIFVPSFPQLQFQ